MTKNSGAAAAREFLLRIARIARQDVHAIRTARPGQTARYKPVHRSIAEATIRAHLSSAVPIGIYPLIENQTRLAVLDLDDHEGEPQFELVRSSARILIKKLREIGLKPFCFRSGGGRGMHIWIFWEALQNARNVRRLFAKVITDCGLKVGTGGIAKGEVELFPKQDAVSGKGLGNLIALPLARQSVPLAGDDLAAIALEEFRPPKPEEMFSADCPVIAEDEEPDEEHPEQRLPGDEAEAEAALKTLTATDRDLWIKIAHILKHEFSEVGFAIWHAWSKTGGDKYKGEADCRKTWDSIVPSGKVGIGTLFHLAKQNRWNGPGNPVIREMNRDYALLTRANQIAIIVKAGNGPHSVFEWLSKQAFLDRLKSQTVEVPGSETPKRMEKARYWYQHPLRESYHYLDFDPAKRPGGNAETWNMWTGFAVKPRPGNWSLLKAHIRDNISQGNETLAEWLMNWMALGLQQPGLVIGTAPVLKGLPGTGKGVVANAYGKLWGPHFVTITHHEHVSGRFGGHLIAKRFVFIDEGTFGGDRKSAGVIKTRVTEPKIILEQKGVDPIQFDNRMIIMIASNELSIVPADIGDRRWMIFEVGAGHRVPVQPHWNRLRDLKIGGFLAHRSNTESRDETQIRNPRHG